MFPMRRFEERDDGIECGFSLRKINVFYKPVNAQLCESNFSLIVREFFIRPQVTAPEQGVRQALWSDPQQDPLRS